MTVDSHNDEGPTRSVVICRAETVLRRFSPKNPHHLSRDEGTGEIRLRSGALALRKDEEGLSVYCRDEMVREGLSEKDVTTHDYEGVAAATVGEINDATNLEVTEDRWPFGEHPRPHVDYSHALIIPPSTASRNSKKKLASKMTAKFRIASIPEDGEESSLAE